MALGEAMLRECSDAHYYADRDVEGADHEGEIERDSVERLAAVVDPRESWLILARTNLLAGKLAKLLDEADIPWIPTRGNGAWNAPVRGEAISAMMNLQKNAPIDGREWQSILKYLPTKSTDGTLLEHGTKARFAKMTPEEAQDEYSWLMPEELEPLGATPTFLSGVRNGRWIDWIEGAERFTSAVEQYGHECVSNPTVRVSTIHGAKGMEADNVALLTTLPEQCFRSAQSDEGHDEETRTFYVGVTRAKTRLVVLNESKPKYRKRIEA
jgi:hypothetical protein